jgi:heme-degrading monooxygenase HmoA
MISVRYGWRVQSKKEAVFVDAWTQGTEAICALLPGARGGQLWRDRHNLSEFTAVMYWDSIEDWWDFRGLKPVNQDAFQIARSVSTLQSVALFYTAPDQQNALPECLLPPQSEVVSRVDRAFSLGARAPSARVGHCPGLSPEENLFRAGSRARCAGRYDATSPGETHDL